MMADKTLSTVVGKLFLQLVLFQCILTCLSALVITLGSSKPDPKSPLYLHTAAFTAVTANQTTDFTLLFLNARETQSKYLE